MIKSLRAFAHRCFRACGFEIMSLRNIDAALAERQAQREAERLRQLVALRAGVGRAWKGQRQGRGGETIDVSFVPAEELESAACSALQKARVVLDIGCGIRPQPYLEADIHICCEPAEMYLDRLMDQTANVSKYVYLQCGINEAVRIFPPQSVDTVFLVDVIEHLDRETGAHALERLSAIARRQIAVFTPLGFMPQHRGPGEKDGWGMDGATWQEHRSGWSPEDFPASDGWQVIACRDFHHTDGFGCPLAAPVGALWAIRTTAPSDP